MTGYEELCQAYFDSEPRLITIDRILRELPQKMRQAISEHLAVPRGTAKLPSTVSGIPTAYVDLFWPTTGQNEEQKWERCTDDRCLREDDDGIYGFCIGVCIERTPGSFDASMIYFTFSVEAFDDQSVELRIKNLEGSIVIDDPREATSYANAAAIAINRIMTSLKSPKAALGSRAPIGFVSSHSTNG